MENKPDIGKAICATLENVRRLLGAIQISGMENPAALVNADNALFAVIDEIKSGRVTVGVTEGIKNDAEQENT